MRTEKVLIQSITRVSDQIYSLKFSSSFFSQNTNPGQFFNVKISDEKSFILRRPFSISQIENEVLEILFTIVGKGSKFISNMKSGDDLDILGPLGNGFDLSGDYEHAILIGGGIGIAPFPLLKSKLQKLNKNVDIFLGFRAKNSIIDLFSDAQISTDDGSIGYHGNVVNHFISVFDNYQNRKVKVFSCGPNIMLKSLVIFLQKNNIDCIASIESYMACGFGICQGCPVKSKKDENKYFLVCRDGPCFDINDIIL